MLFSSYKAIPEQYAIKKVQAYEIRVDNRLISKQEIMLPSVFATDFPNASAVNYVFEVEIDSNLASVETPGIYLPWSIQAVAISVNGRKIYSDLEESYLVNRARYPTLVRVPNDTLTQDQNLISIEVHSAYPGEGKLQAIFFGPYSEMQSSWESMYFFKVSLVHILSTVLILLCVFAFLTYFLIDKNKVYVWFILLGLSWTMSNELFLQIGFPYFESYRRSLGALFTGATIAIIPIFSRRYLDYDSSGHEKLYLILSSLEIITLSAFLLVSPQSVSLAIVYIKARALLTVIYAFALYVVELSKNSDRSIFALWLLAVVGSSITLPLYSFLSVTLSWDLVPVQNLLTAAFHLVLIFSSIYLHTIRESFIIVKNQKKLLDFEIDLAKQRIYSQNEELIRAKEATIISKERERIMQDIHDGVAGQLTAALALARRDKSSDGQLVDLIKDSLTDLRLVIDSLSLDELNFESLISDIRVRVDPTLSSLGLRTKWNVNVPGAGQLNSLQTLEIYRFLQEAIVNVIKHADATALQVLVEQLDFNTVKISVLDDGIGIVHSRRRGRGLINMEKRISRLNGSFEITSDKASPGTLVSAVIPLS